ncbi:potassium channel family protein [Massilia sp. W12]|uniref:potassium channel family protein n=1 Tax=Massilia sp. W12 TaxID=3126507 RepID=UPI0030D12FBA
MRQHEPGLAQDLERRIRRARPLLLLALALSIPAFYLELSASGGALRHVGRGLYVLVALLTAYELGTQMRRGGRWFGAWRNVEQWRRHWLEGLIIGGALLSAWHANSAWSQLEWLLRLGYCAFVFARLCALSLRLIAPKRLSHILLLGLVMLALAGLGFYMLEPSVESIADGAWLAFTTLSTVGYGDLYPTTPPSRVFAVFTVLLGYALFSLVTASIAALFVGEDEKRLERELHADIRALRAEVAALRADLQQGRLAPPPAATSELPPD